MLEISIPLTPPSGNHYTKHTRSGVHYMTSEARKFISDVAVFASGAAVLSDNGFRVSIAVCMGADRRGRPARMDVDNAAKVTLDALETCGVFRDRRGKVLSDAAVVSLTITKGWDFQNPRTVIRIEENQK